MEYTNLTPHTINIVDGYGNEVKAVPPSGIVARIDTEAELYSRMVDGVELYHTKLVGDGYCVEDGENIPLPAMKPDHIYIVSGIFRANCPRQDFYQPGRLVRNGNGQPIGCQGLSQ